MCRKWIYEIASTRYSCRRNKVQICTEKKSRILSECYALCSFLQNQLIFLNSKIHKRVLKFGEKTTASPSAIPVSSVYVSGRGHGGRVKRFIHDRLINNCDERIYSAPCRSGDKSPSPPSPSLPVHLTLTARAHAG